jgi:hypothetical protein
MTKTYVDDALINALDGTTARLAEEEKKRIEAEARQSAFDLLFVQGLYASASTDTPLGEAIERNLRYSGFGFDLYCVSCKRETTFRVRSKDVPGRGANTTMSAHQVTPPKILAVHATCQRDWTVYTYVVLSFDQKMTKIGQWPSMAEIAFGELRTIDRSLEAVDRRELGKALGLFSHDSAIGAFAYLRRVFERMIDRAHARQEAVGHPISGFAGMRMDQKVAALKDELPDMVVRNSGVFSILSLGLHELTEKQCTNHFPVIKAVLFQMLEQEEHKRNAALTQRETEAALQQILSNPTAGDKVGKD